jgi:iron complex transport system substrate-binding protein
MIFSIKMVVISLVMAPLVLSKPCQAQGKGAICVTDMLGEQVCLEEPAQRIVASFFFEEIFAFGAQDKIVGWSRSYWEGRRQWTWEKYVNESNFPVANMPDIGYAATGNADCEKIASLKPDLFIAPFKIREIESRLEKYGISCLHVDFHTQENTCRSIRILGKVLGREKRAENLIDFYKAETEKVTFVLNGLTPKKKPTVYVEVGLTPYSTYGSNYMFGKIVELAGGENIAQGFGVVRTGSISPEYLLKADPDIIIITGANWTEKFGDRPCGPKLGYYANHTGIAPGIREKLDRPGWRELSAVKNNRVFFVHHGLSRHIYDFVALQQFAKWFHPEAFKGLDPHENWARFHNCFLPVTLSGDWSLP